MFSTFRIVKAIEEEGKHSFSSIEKYPGSRIHERTILLRCLGKRSLQARGGGGKAVRDVQERNLY